MLIGYTALGVRLGEAWFDLHRLDAEPAHVRLITCRTDSACGRRVRDIETHRLEVVDSGMIGTIIASTVAHLLEPARISIQVLGHHG